VTGGDAGAATVAGVIDVGSNSVLLLVVAVDAHGTARVVDEALATTRLGEALRSGAPLDPVAAKRTRDAVVEFAARARRAGAARVSAFATAAARDASDGTPFARALANAAGVPVEILSAGREALLAYEAVRDVDGPLLAVDVGGRTTEVTLGTGATPIAAASLPVGALSGTERHGGDLAGLADAVDAALRTTDVVARAAAMRASVAASGGTATALAAVDLGLAAYDGARVHGHVLETSRMPALARSAARTTTGALDPGRAAILPAGATILARVAAAAGAVSVVVSDRGVRHAYLCEMLGGGIRFARARP
jgi:exopolyphosphatase/guanosine-5'-triphosphate,3'-diphosphate pyrophosphatase